MINEKDVNSYASAQLLTLRTTTGISQMKLGMEVGISGQQVYKYERAMNCLSVGRVMQFADAFDVSVLTFFPERDKHYSYKPVPPPIVRFIRLLGKISPDHYDKVYNALKAIVKLSGDME